LGSVRGARGDTEDATAALVRGARRGDAACWDALVARFAPLVWTITRSCDLNAADAAETTQTVWLRLAENLDGIKHPERIGAWIVTTARRESIRQHRRQQRESLGNDHVLERDQATPADVPLLVAERDAALHRAFDRLPERSRTLLLMLLSDPPMSYGDISEALEMPIGSIGPTRARVLGQLRKHLEDAGVSAAD
jgi:RNA polymerase sigma factor (sigma-70 family)